MNQSDYLDGLRKQLSQFSKQEQNEVVAELESHLEAMAHNDGQVDLQVIGSVDALANGMKQVYRPNRWIDFLLVVIPLLLIPILGGIVGVFFSVTFTGFMSLLLPIVIGLPILLFGSNRGVELRIFWTIKLIMNSLGSFVVFVSQPTIFDSYNSARSLAIGLGVLLLFLIVRFYWEMQTHRNNSLLLLFGFLPLLNSFENILFRLGASSYINVVEFGLLTQYEFVILLVCTVVGLGFFFLAERERLRWLGLFISAVSIFFSQITGILLLSLPTWMLASSLPSMLIVGLLWKRERVLVKR